MTTLLTERETLSYASSFKIRSGFTDSSRALNSIKTEISLHGGRYDIFLSHPKRDEDLIIGIYLFLKDVKNKRVFVDWIAHPSDHSVTTPEDAENLRKAMGESETLLVVDSQNADQSIWMPWEIGWFDAKKGKVAVLPVVANGTEDYRGREFLGLYPYVDKDLRVIKPGREKQHTNASRTFYVTESATSSPRTMDSMPFDTWQRSAPGTLRP